MRKSVTYLMGLKLELRVAQDQLYETCENIENTGLDQYHITTEEARGVSHMPDLLHNLKNLTKELKANVARVEKALSNLQKSFGYSKHTN